MKDFKEKFMEFLMQDKYITDECYIDFINKYKDILNEKYYIQLIKEKNKFLKYYNNKYLNKVLISKKDYFDNMFSNTNLNILLDDEQRKALIIDDNALVIAGAGAGKTTTMAAKVKYLVDNGYNEQDILVVSFTKKACEEIANIIHNDLNYPTVSVKTFHSLGLDILKSSGMDIDMIIEETTKYKIISNYIKNIVFKDKEYLKELIDAFKSVIYFDEEVFNYKEFIDYQKHKYNKKLLNSNLNLQEYNDIVINNRRNKKKTIKGDYVRSKEEVDIANYLFVNGINYKYEAIYKDEVNNIKSKPDFTIRQNSLVNYIEHFGIDKNFDNKMYDIKNLKAYLSTINIKEKYLNDNDKYKDFIITYSNYLDPNITYLSDLENKLIKKGYVLNRKSDEQIFTALMNTDTDSYFSKFIYDIVIPFISTFKRNNYKKSYFKKLIKENRYVQQFD